MPMKSPSEASPDPVDTPLLCFLTILRCLLCGLLFAVFRLISAIAHRGFDSHVPEAPMLSDEDVGQRSESKSVEVNHEIQPTGDVSVIQNEPVMMNFSDENRMNDSSNHQFPKLEFPARVSDAERSVPSLRLEDSDIPESEGSIKLNTADSDSVSGEEAVQQKMELVQKKKQSKTIRLPTIPEDSESLKMAVKMTPLMLSKKIDHKDVIGDVHKFYKCYVEKMHKLDILNQQTLDALSLVRLKDRAEANFSKKKKKRLCLACLGGKLCGIKVGCDEAASTNLVDDLVSKLDQVYVSQLCLSWEILDWQHSKALELLGLDRRGSHHYDQVAVEFHQFQVALQRFLESEAFHGPDRVRRYVEKRRVCRGLIQVPPILDDSLRDKKVKKEEGECAITISALVPIIDKARRVFFEFLQAEKPKRTKPVLPVESSQSIFIQARMKLDKKKKRLQKLMQSQGFIETKIRKRTKEKPLSEQVLFLATVELKLVERVLSMPVISRDQILWCHRKLDEINLVDKRSKLYTSFLPFPC